MTSSPTAGSASWSIAKVDGEPVAGSPTRDALIAAGFVAGYRGYALRSAAPTTDRAWARPSVVRSER